MKKNTEVGLATSKLLIIVILLCIAIGGLLYYFNNQKRRNFITMAKEYITEARALVTEERIVLPDVENSYVLISTSKIDDSKGLLKSSFGEKWIVEKSYIIIKNQGTEYNPVYTYYIALEDEGGNCVELTKEADLSREGVNKKCNIEERQETAAIYLK